MKIISVQSTRPSYPSTQTSSTAKQVQFSNNSDVFVKKSTLHFKGNGNDEEPSFFGSFLNFVAREILEAITDAQPPSPQNSILGPASMGFPMLPQRIEPPNPIEIASRKWNEALEYWGAEPRDIEAALTATLEALQAVNGHLPPPHPFLAALYQGAGLAHKELGNYPASEAFLTEALNQYWALHEQEPDNLEIIKQVNTTATFLGAVKLHQGKRHEGHTLLNNLLPFIDSVQGEREALILDSSNNLNAEGFYAEAMNMRQHLPRAVRNANPIMISEKLHTALQAMEAAFSETPDPDYKTALKHALQAHRVTREIYDETTEFEAGIINSVGICHYYLKQLDEAEKCYRKAQQQYKELATRYPDDDSIARTVDIVELNNVKLDLVRERPGDHVRTVHKILDRYIQRFGEDELLVDCAKKTIPIFCEKGLTAEATKLLRYIPEEERAESKKIISQAATSVRRTPPPKAIGSGISKEAADAMPRYLVFSYAGLSSPVAKELVKGLNTANGTPLNLFTKYSMAEIEEGRQELTRYLKNQLNTLTPPDIDTSYTPLSQGPELQDQPVDLSLQIRQTIEDDKPSVYELRKRVLAQQLFSQISVSKGKQSDAAHQKLASLWGKTIAEVFEMPVEVSASLHNLYGPSKENPSGKFDLLQFLQHQGEGTGLNRYWGQQSLKQDVAEKLIAPILFERVSLGARSKRAFGWIFHGEPGTGKTFLASLLAQQLNVKPIMLTKADVSNPYEGMREANIIKKLELAKKVAQKNGASLVVLDDMEQLGLSRNPKVVGKAAINHDAVGSLLTILTRYFVEAQKPGSPPVFIIGTGNYPEHVDKALKEAHRLGGNLKVGLPDLEGRQALLENALKAKEVILKGQDPLDFEPDPKALAAFAKQGAKKTEGMTARQVLNVVELLADIPTEGYTVSDLNRAIAQEFENIRFRSNEDVE